MWTRVLEVDLGAKSFRFLQEEELFHRTMGGTGAAGALLARHLDPAADPLGPENVLVLAIGPFSNVLPVATKTAAMFKSPHTGHPGESHAGGRLALALYNAGLGALVVKGAAAEPVVLDIFDDRVDFRPAGSIWGLSAAATERVLRGREWTGPGKRSIVRIGPAGERLSTYAGAAVDTQRHFGRLGMGAVMGSKRLKALVVGGSRWLPVPDKKRYRRLYDGLFDRVVSSGEMAKYHDLGTAVNVARLDRIMGLPTRNFSQGSFEGARRISGEAFGDDYLDQQIACAHCQCGCIHMASLREQFHREHGFKTARVSYDFELIYALGSNLSIDDPRAILRLLHQVEKEGWDAMSLGVTLAWATEAFLAGAITTGATGGLVLRFGDAEGYLEILRRMATGAGEFYADLERGAAWCGRKYGCPEFAMTFGGNEAPGYLTGENAFTDWLVGVRHSHLDGAGYALDQKLLEKESSLAEQAAALAAEARFRMTLNSLMICLFARNLYTREVILEGLDLLWRPCTEVDLDSFNRETLKRKYELKRACGWSPGDLELPGKLDRMVAATGPVDPGRIRQRAALYWREVGL